jgi:hypothetical protein
MIATEVREREKHQPMDDDAITEPQPKVLKPIILVLKPHVHDVPIGHRTGGASEDGNDRGSKTRMRRELD